MQEKHTEEEERLWNLTETYKKGYEPDLQKGLVKLKSRIAQDKQKTVTTKVFQIRKWVTRVAAVTIFAIWAGVIYQNFSQPTPIASLQTQEEVVKEYLLPDGSIVWVNKNSRLSFPVSFEEDKRVVQLEGEAFFKVEKNADRPFVVQAGDTEVQVIGTTFNLSSYSKEAHIVLNVVEGKVAFIVPATGEKTVINAKEKVSYQKQTQKIATTTNDWLDTAWASPQLTFDNTPLSQIIYYLKKNFQVNVSLIEENLGDCTLTTTLVDNNLAAILKRVETTFPVKFETLNAKAYQMSGSCR